MSAQPEREPQWMRDRKAIFATCNAFGFTRAQRLEVAVSLLNREVESFSDLTPEELARLRDAFTGAVLVATICNERRRGDRR